MAIILCSFEGCVRRKETKLYCLPHYKQYKRGSVLRPLKEFRTLEWLYNDSVIRGSGCWGWSASKDSDGYGRIHYNNRSYGAHRVSYELRNGSIPDGLVIDHLCHNPECSNPDHLQAVTQGENLQNSGASYRSTTGVRGVYWYKQRNKYGASISLKGSRKHLGFFDSFEEARAARTEAEKVLYTNSPPCDRLQISTKRVAGH